MRYIKRISLLLSICIFSIILLNQFNYDEISKIKGKEEPIKEVVIPTIFLVDTVTNIKNNEDLVNNFNEKYKGQYKIEVEWMSDTASAYRSRIKMLNATDELPAIITDVRFSPEFYQLLVDGNRLLNIRPYVENDSEWKNSFEPQVFESSLEKDGSMYLSPISTSCFSYSGVFWNKKLFAQAGIYSFPETWDEFWGCLEKLSKQGITPLSTHTAGTAWAPMLFGTASLGDSVEGREFMKVRLPKDYNNNSGRELVKNLKRLFMYSTKDYINRDFDVAFEHFSKGETAMLPNGYWMVEQMKKEWNENIGFAPFPKNIVVASPEMSGWALTNGYSKDVQQGAMLFLKYRTEESKKEKQNFLELNTSEKTSLEQDYIKLVKNNPVIIPNYQLQWNPILQQEVFQFKLPQLANGTITEEEFLKFMNESVINFEKEN
jgi:raffinose/stachyose/melibiose transport system substrate-binding protein